MTENQDKIGRDRSPLLKIKILQARRALLVDGKSDKAKVILEKSYSLGKKDEEFLYLYSLTLLTLGSEESEVVIATGIRSFPDSSALHAHKIQLLVESGRGAQLEEYISQLDSALTSSFWVNAKLLELEALHLLVKGSRYRVILAQTAMSECNENWEIGGYDKFLEDLRGLIDGNLELDDFPDSFHWKSFRKRLERYHDEYGALRSDSRSEMEEIPIIEEEVLQGGEHGDSSEDDFHDRHESEAETIKNESDDEVVKEEANRAEFVNGANVGEPLQGSAPVAVPDTTAGEFATEGDSADQRSEEQVISDETSRAEEDGEESSRYGIEKIEKEIVPSETVYKEEGSGIKPECREIEDQIDAKAGQLHSPSNEVCEEDLHDRHESEAEPIENESDDEVVKEEANRAEFVNGANVGEPLQGSAPVAVPDTINGEFATEEDSADQRSEEQVISDETSGAEEDGEESSRGGIEKIEREIEPSETAHREEVSVTKPECEENENQIDAKAVKLQSPSDTPFPDENLDGYKIDWPTNNEVWDFKDLKKNKAIIIVLVIVVFLVGFMVATKKPATNQLSEGDYSNQLNEGVFKDWKGDRYEGEFYRKSGKIVFHGQGKYSRKNGDRYEGEWKDGEKHGLGKMYDNFGRLFLEGEWVKGKFSKKVKVGSKKNQNEKISNSKMSSLISKANVGDVTSQLTLGKIWYHGNEGSLVNFKKAIYWFSIAAEQGSAEAQFYLGIMYANGEGVRKDNKAALEWFTLAGEQGHSDAQKQRRIMNLHKNTPYPQYYPFRE